MIRATRRQHSADARVLAVAGHHLEYPLALKSYMRTASWNVLAT
jgi:hypothetical protein